MVGRATLTTVVDSTARKRPAATTARVSHRARSFTCLTVHRPKPEVKEMLLLSSRIAPYGTAPAAVLRRGGGARELHPRRRAAARRAARGERPGPPAGARAGSAAAGPLGPDGAPH